jgi:leucyl aminopeptidase
MTALIEIGFATQDMSFLETAEGRVAVLVGPGGEMDPGARRVNTLTRGALARLAETKAFAKAEEGDALLVQVPYRLAAEALLVVKLGRRAGKATARKAGAAIAKRLGAGPVHVLAGAHRQSAEIAYGIALRAYDFRDHRSSAGAETAGPVTMHVSDQDARSADFASLRAVAEGVVLTRDLVNEPSNVLTTSEFAARLEALAPLGLTVRVMDEPELETLGMRALLGVGQGSESPSKVVTLEWNGGGDAAPLALVGKGVVFDTGGISLKPAGGMEDMTMDMGGAGVVAGVMKAIALRKAKANVVGLVGLVENMPDGRAQRPGDVVRSMKGDTIEVINTDAEGRLVLADVLWYAQETYKPAGMIDLATLTGAMIIALGHDNAGVFSNDDALCTAFLKAAEAEGEGAWRLPMGNSYDKLLKSNIADMKNVGGRPAGSISAAQLLKRFVKDDVPWIHLDIAGVASLKSESDFAPKGATGWGVRALDRLIRDAFEG